MQESKGERGFSAIFLSYVVSATNFRPGAACVRGALVLPKLQKGGIFLKQTLATKTHAAFRKHFLKQTLATKTHAAFRKHFFKQSVSTCEADSGDQNACCLLEALFEADFSHKNACSARC